MSDGIAGRVALVTGAAGGIGAAVADRLARRGAVVAAVDLDGAGLDRVVAELSTGAGRACAYPLDVCDTEEVDALVASVEREVGPIAVLVNAAGVLRTGPATGLTDADWTAVVEANLGGVIRMCRAVARAMVARRAGAIVTVGSNSAGVPRMGMAAYAASKAAAAHFTHCLGLELAGAGIRCNVVAPGSTDTRMLRSMWTDGGGAADVIRGSLDAYKVGIPLGRLAQPADIAEAVAFLASDAARHITMQSLYVDGGAALHA
jgi:2,3-dihydro-2,3-dihydroxybenzoate dehydrogenase